MDGMGSTDEESGEEEEEEHDGLAEDCYTHAIEWVISK